MTNTDAVQTPAATSKARTDALVATLVALGGREWCKNGMRRVYFSADLLAKFYGLRCTLYGTGNVESATLHGEKISNTSANFLRNDFADMKFWWDAETAAFDSKSSTGAANHYPHELKIAEALAKHLA